MTLFSSGVHKRDAAGMPLWPKLTPDAERGGGPSGRRPDSLPRQRRHNDGVLRRPHFTVSLALATFSWVLPARSVAYTYQV